MKLVISEGQYKNLSESMDFGLEELPIEEIQKYNLFISTINKQIKDQYPFVDEIKLSDERLYSFANRFNPSFIGFQREIRTVLYFEVYTTKNLNFIENLDFNKFLIIDTINFSHDFGFAKLKELAAKVGIKNIPTTNENNVELIRDVFFKLYTKFKKSVEAK